MSSEIVVYVLLADCFPYGVFVSKDKAVLIADELLSRGWCVSLKEFTLDLKDLIV